MSNAEPEMASAFEVRRRQFEMHHIFKPSEEWKKMNSPKMKFRLAGLKKLLISRPKDADSRKHSAPTKEKKMISNDSFAAGVLLVTACRAEGKVRGKFFPAEGELHRSRAQQQNYQKAMAACMEGKGYSLK